MRKLNRSLRWMVWPVFAVGSAGLVLAQGPQSKDPSAQPSALAQIVAPSDAAGTASLPLTAVVELPDSPGIVWAQSQAASQPSSSVQTATPSAPPSAQQSNPPVGQTSTPQTNAPDANAAQDQKLQRPVGTAAAGAPGVSGITAAQPSGVAIAPAKQRRVRTIVLRVGAIVGAGAALGTVIALTAATPSRPPGAH